MRAAAKMTHTNNTHYRVEHRDYYEKYGHSNVLYIGKWQAARYMFIHDACKIQMSVSLNDRIKRGKVYSPLHAAPIKKGRNVKNKLKNEIDIPF